MAKLAFGDYICNMIKLREWDSIHFGLKVGEAQMAGVSDIGVLMNETSSSGFDLVYIKSEKPLDLPDLFCDTRVEYEKLVEASSDVCGVMVKSALGKISPETFIPLSLASGVWSRFKRDPRFPEEGFRHLYTEWILNSFKPGFATDILFTGAPELPTGLLTYKVDGDEAEIGLVAVSASERGKGLASGLLWEFEHRCAASGVKRMRVATQGGNLQARRCYETAGYRLHAISYTYHLWANGNGKLNPFHPHTS